MLFQYALNNFFQNWPGTTNCLIHPDCSIPSDASVYKDDVLTLLAVTIIIPSAVFTELLVSVVAVKDVYHNQRSQRCGGQCPSHKRCLLKSIHVLALWNILIASQLVT